MTEPARRFVIAQSWWIASELVRRSPKLLLVETHPGDGMYDCLSLVRRTDNVTTTLIDLNREDRAHVHVAEAYEPITWADAFAARGGHDVVRSLEQAAGLIPAAKAPPTGQRVLTYRLIARILTSLIDDRHEWDARSGQLDSSGMDATAAHRPELLHFPSVVESLRDSRPDDLFGRPGYRFWMLLRDNDPVAVFDTDGRLHLPNRRPSELLPIYKRSRSLTTVIGEVLGHVLP
ncbi:hypothetical protein LWC33_24015 [Pseudonocardia sp. RS11V-5]|uniref:TY-Chap2 family putative peptide chaperone n=1 Tax=Pseudonocardia terrae TaxID=2905831 RepID=UPI001E4E2518|nr:hypothetical protein [Pseudonocardia terrae]MCE3554511.1 hypothetical protein [Pseudonocardia terrae]